MGATVDKVPVSALVVGVVVPAAGVVPGDVGDVGVAGDDGDVGDVGVVVGVVGAAGVVVGVVAAATKLLVKFVVQMTVLPPPLDDPLHWFTVTGSAVAVPVTLHCTRPLAPPPLPDPLHWVTVALVVLATGAQMTVGWVPPPVPDPTHWLTDTPGAAVPVGTVLTTETLHKTLLPPPNTIPLHWSTEVTS